MEKSIIDGLIDFKAPYLTEKLIKENILNDENEAEKYFLELKRWLILIHTDVSKNWKMYSLKIDEVWHQFILYTGEYFRFCSTYFGNYIHHSPSNAPKAEETNKNDDASIEDFRIAYHKIFKVEMPNIWYDKNSITYDRRIVNYFVNRMNIEQDDDILHLKNKRGDILLSLNDIAKDELKFITNTPAFYVREIPGVLTKDEKIELVKFLVEFDVLRSS